MGTQEILEMAMALKASERFAIAVEARDACGNLTSAPARFVTVRRSCPASPGSK